MTPIRPSGSDTAGTGTTPARQGPPLSHMTMRVYQVDRYGTVTRDSGQVIIAPAQGLTPARDGYPPCQCPHHRTEQGKSR